MGSMQEILAMMPGVNQKALAGAQIDEKKMAHIEAIITSMTPKERQKPEIINFSRKQRIAQGCGRPVSEVNALLKQFEQMRKLMKQFSNPKKLKRSLGGFKGMFR